MTLPIIPRSLLTGSRDLGLQTLLDGLAGLEPFAGQVAFPVDIEENDEAFLLRVDVPGVTPDQINLESKETRAGQLLTLTIDKTASRTTEGTTVHRQERVTVHGCRAFILPKDVDADRIAAKQEHGVLTVTLPRRHPIQPGSRKITIQGGVGTPAGSSEASSGDVGSSQPTA